MCLTLWVVAVVAALSLLGASLETLQPPALNLPWYEFRLLGLIKPLILVGYGRVSAP